jgi:hypothetical protein
MGAPSFFHRNWVWVSPERSFFHRHFDRDAFSPKMGFTPAEMVLVPTRFRAKIAELDFFSAEKTFYSPKLRPESSDPQQRSMIWVKLQGSTHAHPHLQYHEH